MLDDYGMYMTYGEAVECRGDVLRPLSARRPRRGLPAEASRPQGRVITYDDVDLPKGRLADRLRAEQYAHFRDDNWLSELLAADTPVPAP